MSFLGVSGLFYNFYSIFDGKILLDDNVTTDQMPHYVASELGLHCLPLGYVCYFVYLSRFPEG